MLFFSIWFSVFISNLICISLSEEWTIEQAKTKWVEWAVFWGYISWDCFNFNLKIRSSSVLMYHVDGRSTPSVESGAILGRLGDHDQDEKMRTSTRGDRSNNRAHANTTQHIVPWRWRLQSNHDGCNAIWSICSIGQQSRKPSRRAKKRRIRSKSHYLRHPCCSARGAWGLPPPTQGTLKRTASYPARPTRKTRLAAARTRQGKPSLTSTRVAVRRLGVVWRGGAFSQTSWLKNITPFPDRTQNVFCFEIELYSLK